jgi:hypothetical protein
MTRECVLALSLLMGVCLCEETTSKPACNKQNRSRIWPDKKHGNPCQPVEICTKGLFSYGWKPLTVHISQASKRTRDRKPCEDAADIQKGGYTSINKEGT